MRRHKRILVIVPDRELVAKLEPFLSRASLEVNHVTTGQSSLILTNNLSFDMVLVQHPLPDLSLDELLSGIRSSDSPCARSPSLFLARTDVLEELRERLESDLDNVLSADAGQGEIESAISQVLGVAARSALRILVRLEVELNPGRLLRACQTVNISSSGMLVRITHPIPVGTELGLRFSLPSDARTIEATGRIVRHTKPDVEGLHGIGIHFLDLSQEGRELIDAFVRQRAALQRPDAAPAQMTAGALS